MYNEAPTCDQSLPPIISFYFHQYQQTIVFIIFLLITDMNQSGGEGNQNIGEISPQLLAYLNNHNVFNLHTYSPDMRIFLDPDGPFIKAPKVIRELLLKYKDSNQSINCDNIDLTSLYFEPMPTENHLCMYYFKRNENGYYHCFQCTSDQWLTQRVIFCQDCFILQNHVGHRYYYQKCKRQQDFCDCGSKSKCKTSLVGCSKHHEDKIIQNNVPQSHRQYFISIFGSLLEIAIYIDMNSSLIEKVCEKLQQLNKNSAFYSKLTLQLIQMESKYIKLQDDFKSKYFIVVLGYACNITTILLQICANNELTRQLIKFIGQNYDLFGSGISYHSPHVSDQAVRIICDYKMLNILADQGYFAIKLFKFYQQMADGIEEKRQLFAKFLKHLFSTQKKLTIQILRQYGTSLEYVTTQQIAWIYLKQIIQCYPNKRKKRTVAYLNNSSKPSKKKGGKKQKFHYKQQQIQQNIKRIHLIIMRCILIITDANIKRLQEFRLNFKQRQIDETKFEFILSQIAYFSNQYIFETECKETPAICIIILLALFKRSEFPDILLSHLWLSLIADSQTIEYAAANTFEFISAIIWSKTHIAIFEGVTAKIKKQKIKDNIERQQQMKYFFSKFLYLRGIIPRQQIVQMRTNDYLEFQQAGKILRTCCNYNQDDETFYFSTAPGEQSFQEKFCFAIQQSTVATMSSLMYANKKIYYGFQLERNLQQPCFQLLRFGLDCQILQKLLQDIWEQYQKNRNHLLKQGYLFLFTLIMINGFTKGQRFNIRELLANLANNPAQLQQYSKSKDQLEMIHRLFCLDQKLSNQGKLTDKNNEKGVTIESQSKQVQTNKNADLEKAEQQRKRKQRFLQKRKKFMKKYEQKRTSILQSIKSKTIDLNINSDEDICLFCHQKNQKDNQLVYLSRLTVNKSLCQAIHGQEQKANTSMYTCFHTLHIKCFINQHRDTRMSGFQCPLCSTFINCFVMRNYRKQNNQLNNIFNNVMITNMVVNSHVYNVDNYFILFFKHIVQAKGLALLIDSGENFERTKMTDKNDNFIMNLMLSIYDDSEELEKEKYVSGIQRFIQQVQKCKSEACKYVQLIIAQCLKQKIMKGPNAEVDISIMEKLRQIIKYEQFEIIKQQVQKITKNKIYMPKQTKMTTEQNKVSLSFSLKQIPKDSTKFSNLLLDNFCYKEHKAKMDYYCLICGNGVCEDCNDVKYQLQHSGVSAYLSIQDYRLHLKNSMMDEQIQVYFNDFKIPYNQREDYDMENQVYTLDVIKMSSWLQKFIQE